jgi:hypothetical protein
MLSSVILMPVMHHKLRVLKTEKFPFKISLGRKEYEEILNRRNIMITWNHTETECYEDKSYMNNIKLGSTVDINENERIYRVFLVLLLPKYLS